MAADHPPVAPAEEVNDASVLVPLPSRFGTHPLIPLPHLCRRPKRTSRAANSATAGRS